MSKCKRTLLDEYNKIYPKAEHQKNGVPYYCVGEIFGMEYEHDYAYCEYQRNNEKCKKCWNRTLNEVEK